MAGSSFSPGGALAGAKAGGAAGGPWGALAGGVAGGFSDFIKSGGDNSDYAKHPITKLVKDAQRAGIHPLYALGSGANYSPMLNLGHQGGSDEGFVRAALAGTAEAGAKRSAGVVSALEQAQLDALKSDAERNHAAALLSNSERALNEQKFNAQPAVIPPYIRKPGSYVESRPGDPTTQVTPSQAPFIEVGAPWGGTTKLLDQNISDAELPGDILQAYQWYKEVKDKLTPKGPDTAGEARRAQTREYIRRAKAKLESGWNLLKQRFLNELHRTK
ncbi:MAG: DNA pilot protein [Microvirus sp.]|nr:MAG: DNA pilot protein [Microvirus sp.]